MFTVHLLKLCSCVLGPMQVFSKNLELIIFLSVFLEKVCVSKLKNKMLFTMRKFIPEVEEMEQFLGRLALTLE